MKKRYKFFIKMIISLPLLSYFIAQTDLKKMFDALRDVPLFIYVILNVIQLFAVALNSIKWYILLPKQPFLKLFKFNLIAQYYSLVLPGQFAGSLIKVYIAGKAEGNITTVAASVITDKATGIIAVLGITVFGIFFSSLVLPFSLKIVIINLALIGLIALFILKVPFVGKHVLIISDQISAKLPFFKPIAKAFETWGNYSSLKLVASLLISFLYQAFFILILMILAKSLSIDLVLYDWCWISGILSIALFLPVSIAGLGVRELTLVGILGFMGIKTEESMALSFAILAITMFLAILGGILELFRTPYEKKSKETQIKPNAD